MVILIDDLVVSASITLRAETFLGCAPGPRDGCDQLLSAVTIESPERRRDDYPQTLMIQLEK